MSKEISGQQNFELKKFSFQNSCVWKKYVLGKNVGLGKNFVSEKNLCKKNG